MFVTAADFDIIPYSIPNIEANNSFQDYVDNAEKEVLKSLLGVTLYASFIEGLDTDYPDQQWLDLRDGVDYLYCEKTYEWVGLRKLLVPYIYQEWLSDTWDTHTGIGVVKGKGENAKVINPGKRIANAYNDFSAKAGNCHQHRGTLYGWLSQAGSAGSFDDSFDETFETFASYLSFNFKDPGTKNTFQL